MQCRWLARVLAALFVSAGTCVFAEDFQGQLPTLSISTKADAFRSKIPTLRVVARPDTFRAALPTLRVAAKSDAFRTTTSTLRVVAKADTFRATTPTLRVVAKADAFRTTTPTLRVVARSDSFRTMLPTLRIVSKAYAFRTTLWSLRVVAKSGTFRATTPRLHVVAKEEDDDKSEGEITTHTALLCGDLRQCFSDEDILREEANLTFLGFSPETHSEFCAAVAQGLGGCQAKTESSGPTGVSGGGTAPVFSFPMPLPDGDASPPGLNFTRCFPLEKYAIELQKRSDAGEDTDAEEQHLMIVISAATRHLMNGRADKYCAQITANLP